MPRRLEIELKRLVKNALRNRGISSFTERDGQTVTRVKMERVADIVAEHIDRHFPTNKVCIQCGATLQGYKTKVCPNKCTN